MAIQNLSEIKIQSGVNKAIQSANARIFDVEYDFNFTWNELLQYWNIDISVNGEVLRTQIPLNLGQNLFRGIDFSKIYLTDVTKNDIILTIVNAQPTLDNLGNESRLVFFELI